MSKAAAKHIRALAYLTRGYEEYADPKDFENAFKDAEDVYLNSGHKLLDDYAMVHRQSNEINDEIISLLVLLTELTTTPISGINGI